MFISLRRVGVLSLLLLLLGLLAACGGSTQSATPSRLTPTPTPTPKVDQGQLVLAQVAQKLNNAKTLHAIFNIQINGSSFQGTINSEVWNAVQNKNRTAVLQSTVSQLPTGSITVSDGKHIWQYDPTHKTVYTGPVTSTATPASGSLFGSGNSGQSQLVLGVVQSILTSSNAKLVSSSGNVSGHAVYDIQVTPQTRSAPTGGIGSLNYSGDVYIDKATSLPVRVNLNLQGFAQVVLDIPKLILNQPIPPALFTFTPPPGTKVLPLSQANATPDTGSLSLVQAQQQAGYHLLSIPGEQTDYQLQGVNALGAPGSQVFTLNYLKGNQSFTIVESKTLANVPNPGGQSLGLRGTTATFSTTNGSPTLAWTENGVGIRITGPLSQDEAMAIARLLT